MPASTSRSEFTAELTRMPSLRGQEATAQDFMARAYRDAGLGVDRWKIEVDDIKHLPGFSPVAVSYDDAWNVVGAHRPKDAAGKIAHPQRPYRCGADRPA